MSTDQPSPTTLVRVALSAYAAGYDDRGDRAAIQLRGMLTLPERCLLVLTLVVTLGVLRARLWLGRWCG